MLQTIEAIYDPKQGLAFSEAVNIKQPVKVLVTFLESDQIEFTKGSPQALLAALKRKSVTKAYSDSEIEAQIQETRDSWE